MVIMIYGLVWLLVSGNHLPSPVDSIREAILTASPNKQYRGIFLPTTPAAMVPILVIRIV